MLLTHDGKDTLVMRASAVQLCLLINEEKKPKSNHKDRKQTYFDKLVLGIWIGIFNIH